MIYVEQALLTLALTFIAIHEGRIPELVVCVFLVATLCNVRRLISKEPQ